MRLRDELNACHDDFLGGDVPPPPAGAASVARDFEARDKAESPSRTARRFDAELDLAELDDRSRPGTAWTARARTLTRGALTLTSRRMCYEGRQVVVLVHLIDATPVPLFGRVKACEYDADGMYDVELDLLPLPQDPHVRQWIAKNS